MGRSLRYTGVGAVATLWTTLLAATLAARFDLFGANPVSYLGSRPGPAAALFTGGLALSAVLLAGFHRYARDRYPASTGFSIAMLVGLAGQLVAAFVPIGGDPTAHRVHTTSALVLGASLPLLMWRFAAAQPPGGWRRLAYALFWAEAGACAAGLYLSARSIAPVAEILPAAVFHAWILTLTVGAERHMSRPGGRSQSANHGSMSSTGVPWRRSTPPTVRRLPSTASKRTRLSPIEARTLGRPGGEDAHHLAPRLSRPGHELERALARPLVQPGEQPHIPVAPEADEPGHEPLVDDDLGRAFALRCLGRSALCLGVGGLDTADRLERRAHGVRSIDHTESAVKKFQEHWGLESDGIVGPVTWRTLATPKFD